MIYSAQAFQKCGNYLLRGLTRSELQTPDAYGLSIVESHGHYVQIFRT